MDSLLSDLAIFGGGTFAFAVAVAVVAITVIKRQRIILAETKKWQQDHTLSFDKISRDENLPLLRCFADGSDLKLCYLTRSYMGIAYEHWFLTDGLTFLEFGSSEIDLNSARVQINHDDHSDFKVAGETTMSKNIRDRMLHVIGMCNYSLCLRNCEHVANYIFRGRWVSHQMDDNKALMTIFKKKIALDVLQKVNSFPASIRPHTFDPDQPQVPVYSFIKDSFDFSRLEYYLDSSKFSDYNILVLGPMGSGKSRLINIFFNSEVCESDVSLESVTREVYFARGRGLIYNEQNGKDEDREIVVADTVGLCDHSWDDHKVLEMIKSRVGCNVRRLDAVFILFNAAERLPSNFVENINKVLEWLKYERTSRRFLFVGTKSEAISEEKKKTLYDQFYRIFKLKKHDDFEPLRFVGFPPKDVLIGNKTMISKTKNSWKEIREFLYRPIDGCQIVVPQITDSFCNIL